MLDKILRVCEDACVSEDKIMNRPELSCWDADYQHGKDCACIACVPQPEYATVDAFSATLALVYRDGILNYDAHDRILRERGYEYLALACNCGGDDLDGHLPCCGWGKMIVRCAECGATAEHVEMMALVAGISDPICCDDSQWESH